MRILVIGLDPHVLDPSSASAKRQLTYFAGYEADIFVLAPGAPSRVSLSTSIKVVRIGGGSTIGATWNTYRAARALLRSHAYDVVTVQDPYLCGLVGMLVAPKRTRFHLQDHSAAFARQPFGIKERFLRPIAESIARRADRVRTVSERGKRGLMALGVSEERIDVVPVAIDLEKYFSIEHPISNHSRLLCVSRLSKEKGIDILLTSIRDVLTRHPQAHLTIVGDGAERCALEERARDLGIASSVTFAGWQTELAPFYANADVYVQSSRFEGWGMAAIEAAASGLPIVMTDVGCAGEVIRDGESGLVVPSEDADALMRAISDLVKDPTRARNLGDAARKAARGLPTFEKTVRRVRSSLEQTKETRRLLILAQAVDEDDPLFGFFVRWLREASCHFSQITVLVLRAGRHVLPSNIAVIPLRRKGSRSRFEILWKLWHESWRRRFEYDAVFVRGDAQYIVLAGWLWTMLRKPIVFWYTHTTAKSLWFWLAVPWVQRIVTAVAESNPLARAIAIGHHIDTEEFSSVERPALSMPRVLVFGRMSPVKRVEMILDALAPLVRDGKIRLTLIGAASNATYRVKLRALLPEGAVWEDRSVSPQDALKLYAEADVVVNATEASMDKVILEAAASGCVVLAATAGMLNGLPPELRWLRWTTRYELAQIMQQVVALGAEERARIGRVLRTWVEATHALRSHLEKLDEIIKSL